MIIYGMFILSFAKSLGRVFSTTIPGNQPRADVPRLGPVDGRSRQRRCDASSLNPLTARYATRIACFLACHQVAPFRRSQTPDALTDQCKHRMSFVWSIFFIRQKPSL